MADTIELVDRHLEEEYARAEGYSDRIALLADQASEAQRDLEEFGPTHVDFVGQTPEQRLASIDTAREEVLALFSQLPDDVRLAQD
jgi:hypothetical protein